MLILFSNAMQFDKTIQFQMKCRFKEPFLTYPGGSMVEHFLPCLVEVFHPSLLKSLLCHCHHLLGSLVGTAGLLKTTSCVVSLTETNPGIAPENKIFNLLAIPFCESLA